MTYHILHKAKNALCEAPDCEKPQERSGYYCKYHECKLCSTLVTATTNYCKLHICGYINCLNASDSGGYCNKHNNKDMERCCKCTRPAYGDAPYCINHVCKKSGCNNLVGGTYLCEEHQCQYDDCLRPSIWNGYCIDHIPKQDNSEKENK